MGDFRIEEIRDQDNETGLKEGGGIEMSIYSAFHLRDACSLSLFVFYLPTSRTAASSSFNGFNVSKIVIGTLHLQYSVIDLKALNDKMGMIPGTIGQVIPACRQSFKKVPVQKSK